jgi:hypothetical protein
MKVSLILSLIALLVVSGIAYINANKLKDAQTMIEQQQTELENYTIEANQLNSEISLNNTEIYRLNVELADALEMATYYEAKTHFREFSSVKELKDWLTANDVNEMEYIPEIYDCDDFARDLMLDALSDGYLVSTELWSCHMLNSTIIGNKVYTIEPQTDEVQFVGGLDNG